MRLVPDLVLLVAFGVLLDGCGSRRGEISPQPGASNTQASAEAAATSVQPLVRLTYATDPGIYVKGQTIAPNTPYIIGGAPASFRCSPPLPKGLGIDAGTGVISGTPLVVVAAGAYQVTASNSSSSTSVPLTITVNEPAPTTAPVVTLQPFVTAGKTGMAASVPDQGAGATYAWNVTGGSLVSGQGTHAVTFSAGSAGTVVLSVTLGNSGGSITGQASAAIVPEPDATLTFPLAVRPGQGGLQAHVPGQPGMKYTWTILQGSSSASITSGQGTPAVGLSAGPAPGTFEIQVLVENQAGDRAIANASVKVKA